MKRDLSQLTRKDIAKIENWLLDKKYLAERYCPLDYQLKKCKSSKIPYIRWGQAWMLYAMSFYLFEKAKDEKINGS